MDTIRTSFIYGTEKPADQDYFKFPKALINNPVFSGLSCEAKLLYPILLNRSSLSQKNIQDFSDEENKVYVVFTINEICETIGCKADKARSILNELEKVGPGLIMRKKTPGKADRIYVKCINTTDTADASTDHSKNDRSIPQELASTTIHPSEKSWSTPRKNQKLPQPRRRSSFYGSAPDGQSF